MTESALPCREHAQLALLRNLLIALLLPFACSVSGAELVVDAECDGGVANGGYVVRADPGTVRIEGRYSRGLREGEFVFYSAAGEKLIVLPYTRGLINGTVRAWHAPGANREATGLKLESDLSAGFVDGHHRTWYANGNPRSDFTVKDGEILSANTWNPDGSELEINSDSAFLQSEIETDFAYYRRLEQLLDAYPPEC
ncbi:MAG TPA: hypothetical protein VKB27_00900 [Gammaproteobacteria bacterium]|nr:hypothetical protein [Gammaproteobacteria bacterium]